MGKSPKEITGVPPVKQDQEDRSCRNQDQLPEGPGAAVKRAWHLIAPLRENIHYSHFEGWNFSENRDHAEIVPGSG